jgi:hypothetical protein
MLMTFPSGARTRNLQARRTERPRARYPNKAAEDADGASGTAAKSRATERLGLRFGGHADGATPERRMGLAMTKGRAMP